MNNLLIFFNKLFDGKLSCLLGIKEFYILPNKKEITTDDLEKMAEALLNEYNNQFSRYTKKEIEEEFLKKLAAQTLEW